MSEQWEGDAFQCNARIMSGPSLNLQITSCPSVLQPATCASSVCVQVCVCMNTVSLPCHVHFKAAPAAPSLLMLSKLHGFHRGLCSTKISAPFHRDHRERMSTQHAVLGGGGREIKRPERKTKERMCVGSLNVTLGVLIS